MEFDNVINRKGTNSYKWDSNPEPDLLPMWVADMDFKTAPAIIEALRKRVEHGVFGYTKVPGEYYRAIASWFGSRHGWEINPDHVIYTTGVVPALSACVKGLAEAGDGVIVQSPVYNLFFSSIRNNKCRIVDNCLTCGADGRYAMDFDNLERLAAEAKLLILCNPHNPVGRIWSREELSRVAKICARHGVTVISDEIHCELTYENGYVPFAPVAEEAGCKYAVCNSPSKAFNTAGLQIANIICPDEEMRARIDRAINDNEVCDVNPFGVVGLIAAYTEGGDWLDSLRRYLWGNYLLVKDFFATNLPQYQITPLEATYLLWINVRNSGMTGDGVYERLMKEEHLRVGRGSDYGEGGADFIRLNIACPRTLLLDGLNRLAKVL